MLQFIVFILSFIGILYGAGLIIASVDQFARKLRISAFSLSFFVLGLLTSIPEFSVGITSISENKPEVFVGNLIGGIPVIFFLIIPLLAIFGKSISLRHTLTTKHLLFTLAVILLPSATVLDGKVTLFEGMSMITAYIVLFIVIELRQGILDTRSNQILELKRYSFIDILKVFGGIALVFISSHFIVENTLYLATLFNVTPFYISILFLALGTNLPELSLAVRSVVSGNKDVAFGDYLGSASANTFFFGLFTLISGGEVLVISNFFYTFIILTTGLSLLYYFAKMKQAITRNDAYILLVLYILFLSIEQFL